MQLAGAWSERMAVMVLWAGNLCAPVTGTPPNPSRLGPYRHSKHKVTRESETSVESTAATNKFVDLALRRPIMGVISRICYGSTRMMVERGHTIQRVDDLHFCLYQTVLHPELFHIHRVKRLEQARYSAEIWVVGLAHVVSVQQNDRVVTEVITEDTELLPKAGLAASFRFRGERDHAQSFGDGMTYILSTQVERLTPQLFPATYRDYVHFAQNRGLFVQFEEWAHDDLAPFTFIDFDARDQELHIHAYHAFPEELTLLKTQSIFEVGKRSPTSVS